MTDLKKYTAEFLILNERGGGLGYYNHFLAESFDRAYEQINTYLCGSFEGKVKYELTCLRRGWDVGVLE